jgi:uncharacterized protein YehS (DUF1456 family)
MTNNDILRQIRYIFNYGDDKMIALFALGDYVTTRVEISDWMKNEENNDYKQCNDIYLAKFLNGLIIENRGKKEGATPKPEKRLNNNIIFRKLKIAWNLQDDNIIEVLTLANLRFSKSELSAFFRKPDHKHFRPCKDQVLRNFLKGIQFKVRGIPEKTEEEQQESPYSV